MICILKYLGVMLLVCLLLLLECIQENQTDWWVGKGTDGQVCDEANYDWRDLVVDI